MKHSLNRAQLFRHIFGALLGSVFLPVLWLTGCAGAGETDPKPEPVVSSHHYGALGLSMLPPQAGEWTVEQKTWNHSGVDTQWRAYFTRWGDTPQDRANSHTVVVIGSAELMSESDVAKFKSSHDMLEKARTTMPNPPGSPRYTDIAFSSEYTTIDGAEFLHASQLTRDVGGRDPQGRPMILESESLVGFHPHDPRVSILVSVSQRVVEGVKVDSIKPLADEVFKGIHFEALAPSAYP